MEIQTVLPPAPLITVLVPTHGRPDQIRHLVDNLKRQTVSPDAFELIVVDDGGDPPVRLDVRELRFACSVLRRRNRGPAGARNAGLALASAPLVLILNDDAVPADDLIERHLAAHEACDPKTAVLGTFHFTESARRSAFVRVLDETDRLFAFTSLRHGQRYNWHYFWTCNISLAVETILEAGGFDEENFDQAICEDVELGLRLELQGGSVLYDETCVAFHDHRLSLASYRKRAFQLGIYQNRTRRKHGAKAPLPPPLSSDPAVLAPQCLRFTEQHLEAADGLFARFEEYEKRYEGQALPPGFIETVKGELLSSTVADWTAGIYADLTGIDAIAHIRDGAPSGTTTAVIVTSCHALSDTQRCIESLRAGRSSDYPVTIIAVDNGSTDGSAEWLQAQPDVITVANPSNFGGPRARNQGLAEVPPGTDWVAFLESDIVVPRGWLDRALYHGSVDPQVGSVTLCSNRATSVPAVPFPGPDTPDAILGFAASHAAAEFRKGEDTTRFSTSASLVRKTLLDQLGGFDETFSPCGFDDHDLAARIRLLGFRVRIAKDAFVYRAESGASAEKEHRLRCERENWEPFLKKWCPEALGSPFGDFSRVVFPTSDAATPSQLHFPLPEGMPVSVASGRGQRGQVPTSALRVDDHIAMA